MTRLNDQDPGGREESGFPRPASSPGLTPQADPRPVSRILLSRLSRHLHPFAGTILCTFPPAAHVLGLPEHCPCR